ncbi:hypothetical protein BT96DRAFT_755161, partial [Gymnopus androsaceus JB14]
YPTIACIALDILPVMASSVPSEQLFSSSGETADDQHAYLSPAQFMKWHWRQDAVDFSKTNQEAVKDINLSEFEGLLAVDEL